MQNWWKRRSFQKRPPPPIETLYAIPARMDSDSWALVTVASESARQGHWASWGRPQRRDVEETCHVPLCVADHGDCRGLGADEHGAYVELCFTADMSKVVPTEHQRRLLSDNWVTAMRVYVGGAAPKRAFVLQEDELLAKAEMQANPAKAS